MQHLVIQEQVTALKKDNHYRADGKYEDEKCPNYSSL